MDGSTAGRTARRLRSDAEHSLRVILEAAERVLGENPAASMELIAEAAGVARTTIHRRFASRRALVDALSLAAWAQLGQAVDGGRPEHAPPLVALHEVTANVLRIKSGWRYALNQTVVPGSPAEKAKQDMANRCLVLLTRAQREGVIDPHADLDWIRRVYYALIGEAMRDTDTVDLDILAARIVQTLLRGAARTSDP